MQAPHASPVAVSAPAIHRRLAPLALAIHVAVATTLSLGLAGHVHAQASSQTIQYDVPAGPLADALNRFAQQSGVAIVLDASQLRGLRTPGLTGSYGIDAGFGILLRGSGYAAVRTAAGYVLQAVPGAEEGEAVLPAVKISDSAVDDGVTEGTGSYTSGRNRTATGLNLSLRETPQSVSVITRQLMEDRRIDDFVDIIEQTNGLSISRYESNRGSMFARGFKIENYLIDGVPTSIDEQWSAGEVLSSTAIYDRIEVLRGSDGLMVGTGNPSAVINMVRKRADSDVFAGSVAVEAGSWSHQGATVDINTPLNPSGTTRARLVADYDQSGSHIDRLENRNQIVFATVEQDIGERTVLSAGLSYQDSHTDSPTWGGAPAWTLGSNDQVVRLDLDRDMNPAADWSYWDATYTNAFVNAEHRFSDTWKAKARYTRGERDSEAKIVLYYPYPIDPATGKSVLALNFGGFIIKNPVPGYAGMYWVENVKDDLNLRVDGGFDLFGRHHELAFGYDRSKERFIADGAPGAVSLANTPSVFAHDGRSVEPTYVARQNYKHHEIAQDAFYAVGRFALAEPLNLIAGARLIDYRVDDLKTPGNSYKSENEVVPYAGLVFDFTRNLSVYASYTSIFQPQNYRDADNRLLSPIEGNSHELGLKGEFFDGRLNASLSVFRMEQDNVAKFDRSVPEDPANPSGPRRSAYVGVDGTVAKGFEAEIAGEILPGWQVSTGYSRFKAEEASGNDVNPLIPRKQFNLFTSYRLPGAWQALTVGGGVRWQSEVWVHQSLAQTLGVPKLEQESYAVVDLMARYDFNDKWSAQLNLNNILDEAYFAPTEDGMQVYWQAPRGAELRIKYQF